jgi:hypothetical protein
MLRRSPAVRRAVPGGEDPPDAAGPSFLRARFSVTIAPASAAPGAPDRPDPA